MSIVPQATVTPKNTKPVAQKKFDFTAPKPRPFLSTLPARIDDYESGVAWFFKWRTSLEYYTTLDQIIDFVVNAGSVRVLDLQTDTGTFALRLAGRKGFGGHIHSFDHNITLLERARQRSRHLNLQRAVEFQECDPSRLPVEDSFADMAVSILDFHRHPAKQFLGEARRMLTVGGHLLLAEMLEPKTQRNRILWNLKKMQLSYLHKKPSEAQGVYFSRDELIALLFEVGFRQVVVQGLRSASSPHQGVFSLVAATK